MTNDWDMGQPDTALLAAASGLETPTDIVAAGGTMQKVGGQYATAVKVQNPRDLNLKTKQLMAEARIAGEAFYYGWGSGKDRVLGPSIGLAMAAARVWGNCVVEPAPLQDTKDAWVMTMTFVDLETGFTVGRQFRQDKQWTVHGKFDAARKDDIRFQIGQSKAARNVILQAVPKWLIDMAMKEAMAGVRERVEKYIEKKGIAAAQDLVIEGLAKHGVTEAAILDKMKVSERKALQVDHIVALRGDLYCLDEGQDRAQELYPAMKAATEKGVTSELNDQLEGDAPPEAPESPQKPPAGATAAKTKKKPKASQPPQAEPESDPEPSGDKAETFDIDPETGERIPADVLTVDEMQRSGGVSSAVADNSDAPVEAEAPEAPEDEGPSFPAGFLARVAGCKAVGQVEDLVKELEDDDTLSAEQLAMMQAKATERITEIRRAYRGI